MDVIIGFVTRRLSPRLLFLNASAGRRGSKLHQGPLDEDVHDLFERSVFDFRCNRSSRRATARPDIACVRSCLFAMERYGGKLPRRTSKEVPGAYRFL